MPDRPLVDTLRFRPSCLEEGEEEEEDPTTTTNNTLEVARSRLLELEAAIERRYDSQQNSKHIEYRYLPTACKYCHLF